MKEKRKSKPKRNTWNTHPGEYGRGLNAMFTARIPKDELARVNALCERMGKTHLDVVRLGMNLL